MLINHQQAKVMDTSTFALFNQKRGHQNFSPRPRGGSFPKFSSRHLGPRSNAAAPTTRYNVVPPPAQYNSSFRPSPPRLAANSRPIFSTAPQVLCQICGKLNHLAWIAFTEWITPTKVGVLQLNL
jgi:hypothetical protein